jgi:hypothetical protein
VLNIGRFSAPDETLTDEFIFLQAEIMSNRQDSTTITIEKIPEQSVQIISERTNLPAVYGGR